MHDLIYIKDFVVILGVAVVVVTLLHRLRIPPIAGFILSGILIGPEALGVISEIEQVELLAEIGVALLLFSIGLELPLDKVKRLWRPVMLGGTLQVGLTLAIAAAIALAFGLTPTSAAYFGCLMALSSTAIVLRGLESRGEIDAPHGRMTLGILIFQDLIVVPMMLAVPLLGGEEIGATEILTTIGRAILIVVSVLIAARLVVPRILKWVSNTRQRQLFVLSVLVIGMGTAWLTSTGGVSLALGAFLAGLVVAGSEYRHQALADVIPFREVFTAVFFVSVGMLLAPTAFVDNVGPILLLFAGILIVKFLIVFVVSALMRLPTRVAVLTSVGLAQVGEFSFVLLSVGTDFRLLSDDLTNYFVGASILSMLVTPFLLALGPTLAAGAGRLKRLNHMLDVRSAEDAASGARPLQDHVIIGGFGIAGIELAQALRENNIAYVICELNSETVRHAVRMGEPLYFGDITNPDVLEHLGVHRARELVVVINDPSALERAVKAARTVAPNLHIIVRTRYVLDMAPLLDAGATEVIPAEVEAAAEVTRRVLNRHQVAEPEIDEQCDRIRTRQEDEPEP